MHLSSDEGITWTQRTTPGAIWNTAVTSSGTVWMLCAENNAYFLAKTWVEKDSVATYSSMPYDRIIARDDAVYTYTSVYDNGMYNETMMVSRDSGATWRTVFSQKTSMGSMVSNIGIGKNSGSALIAQTTASGLLRYTTDNGSRWETIPLPQKGYQTWVDCADDSTLFISTFNSIWSASLPRDITGVLSEPSALTDKLVIYPNPAAEFFTVSAPAGAAIVARDVFGRLL